MSTLQAVELGVLGPLQVRQHGAPVTIPGAKPRAILTMLGLHCGSLVSADTLVELLWGEDPPRTAAKALQTHISSLRRTLGDGFVLTAGAGWTLAETDVDASRYTSAARLGRDAAAAGDSSQAVARFEDALALWRGIPELPEGRRGTSEKTRWIEAHAALVEDRADALLATGRAAEIIGELEAAVAEAPLRERRWGQLMLALYRAGRQGEALGTYRRARAQLADELGVDPGPELRRLEAAIVAQDSSLDITAARHLPSVMRAVTFLLTDIEGSTAAWEQDATAMALALARHDELVEQVVTSRGGRLIKTRGEGDATFSVFERPSAAAAAAIELQEAIGHEPWALQQPMRIRVALHTGEVELRDGDYFGRAVNRAARLRSLADGGQILCSGATAELVIDSLADDVVLADLGMRQLKNLPRPEHVFELRLDTDFEHADAAAQPQPTDAPLQRPDLPTVLVGHGPFVGRVRELDGLLSAWQAALAGGMQAVLIAGEPGVGKTRLAGEWSRHAYEQGAVVLYGRSDEDLGAPYQPFAEALRTLVPCVGPDRLRGLRGVEALLPLVPGLNDVLPDLAAPTRADPDTERYALFDAVVALLALASLSAPVVLVLDDLHWAAKPTLLLLRHLLRFGEHARVQIIGTYRSTDLDRSHPLAAMLADLHRDGTANRVQLSGLDSDDVTAYVAAAGYDDDELARALAAVTGGNPFFLIEALRHVDESGGRWDPSTLPQGVREAVSRRLSRLAAETNTALAAAAVVGSRFALELVEQVVGHDLVEAFDEAAKAGIVIEESGGRYRFNHAIVRQSLLAELPSVRRMRLHQRIATTLESQPGADDELLAELAYHYFECAWAGNAAKAVEYCRRAADQAMARLAYEGAADLYDQALHALEEIDDELPDRDDLTAALLIARCEAVLAAGDVASAASAVAQLQAASGDSARLAAWATCFDGQLSMLIHPERLDEVEAAVGAAARKLAQIADAAGEANAHTVRAGCLARLGRIGDCEIALDDALTAARRAGEHRRVNAVLANAPLAALWGPNPVPRAGGRCLDVVRLLRITTDSPAVEATSTRCQAVLEAFRGRAEAARRMIDSARRMVTELGLRHALLEVEQFAGIVELVVDDAAAAEAHLRHAYAGFRRMGLDADTAETAALLGRACLVLGRGAEADELCSESERLAGHALKASIAWRTLRAQLLSRGGDHDEARRVAAAAVALAERTDALVDHGDACLALATVLGTAGDAVDARAAAKEAADLYERKGAAALVAKARRIIGEHSQSPSPPALKTTSVETDTAAVRAGERVAAAINRKAWDEFEQLFAPAGSLESRRKIVGFNPTDLPSDWIHQNRLNLEAGEVRLSYVVIAVRGERLALVRLVTCTADESPGAPRDEFLQLYGIDEAGRVALQVWFDLEDIDAALAELDATQALFEEEHPQLPRLENTASQVRQRLVECFAARDWDALAELLADDMCTEDRRRVVNAGLRHGRDAAIEELQAIAVTGTKYFTSTVIAMRGERLVLSREQASGNDPRPESFRTTVLDVIEIDADARIVARVIFDADDFEAAVAELDARCLAGEAATALDNACVRVGNRALAALDRGDWDEFEQLFAPGASVESHRKVVGFTRLDVPFGDWRQLNRRVVEAGDVRGSQVVIAVRGERLALARLTLRTTDKSPGAPQDEFLQLYGIDAAGRVALQVWFDVDDTDAAYAELDATHTRFEQETHHQARRLENTASQLYERFKVYFAARDWRAITEMLADNVSTEDRRRVTNAGIRQGPDAVIAELSGLIDVVKTITSEVIATRGARLFLSRARTEGYQDFRTYFLDVVEVDADGRAVARVVFDPEDFDAAIAELDARYLAGEAAAHARVWSVIAGGYTALGRREIPLTTPAFVNADHRRGTAFASGELLKYLRAGWALDQDVKPYIESVHRLSNLGAVVTHAAHGTSRDGFDAEWREVVLLTIDGDAFNRCELFDEPDLDAALARFDQLSRPAPRLENTAARAYEHFWSYFAARNWDAVAGIVGDDISGVDRRRVVNAEAGRGRDAMIKDLQATADIGFTIKMLEVIAIRGRRLALVRLSASGHTPETIQSDALNIVEIDDDERIAWVEVFDLDDFDTAIAELDARYLASEAAAHGRTWSLVASGYAALNRHELPATTRDCVNIDHRQARAFAPGELPAYMHATWDVAPNVRGYIETVHRLSDFGTVVNHVVRGSSQQGFDAEWREVALLTFGGELINRIELFDESDLDAALARFDQLDRPTPRLENTASRVTEPERLLAYVATAEWDAMAELLADDFCNDDRRPVVGSGIRHGRDAQIVDARTLFDLWDSNYTSTVIAIRGERLALRRSSFSNHDPSEAFRTEVFNIVEINADERVVALVTLDPDDFDAALTELDARYLAGEAAPHARTWSVIARANAATNQQETLPITPDHVAVDHRLRTTLSADEMTAYVRTAWDLTPDLHVFIEVVHRLTDLGAVVGYMAHGTSPEGLDAEWRQITLITVEGELGSRCEIFDESDLDAALARFDQLDRSAPRLENTATRVFGLIQSYFAVRGWDAMATAVAENMLNDDRRHLLNSGVRHGRDVEIANGRAFVEIGGERLTSTAIAVRGDRLALCRSALLGQGQESEAFRIEFLSVIELDADERLAAHIAFDPDDLDAAIAELDARYLAGEAAAHASTWPMIAGMAAGFNQQQLPTTTTDSVYIDHRPLVSIEGTDLDASIRAVWDITSASSAYFEEVHRLDELGAVVTLVLKATTQLGLDAELRMVEVLTIEGDRYSHIEVFDESDLGTALARFDELHRQTRRLENTASRVFERFSACWAGRNWGAVTGMLADDLFNDDRRRVVSAGIRHGRDATVASMQASAAVGLSSVTSTVIATRGERLALTRDRFLIRDQRSEEVVAEVLGIVEIGADERITARLALDLDDFDAAIAELDARYLAGEAAVHAGTWSALARAYAAANNKQLRLTPDCVNVDHRRLATIESGHLAAYIRAGWDDAQDFLVYIEAVHRLSTRGAVFTQAACGTSHQGFDAEWREVILTTFEGDLVNRCELFDEADIDAALARFEELQPQPSRPENAATQVSERFLAHFVAQEWDAMAELLADDYYYDDHRSVVNAGIRHGRDAAIENMRAVAGLGITDAVVPVIATRGQRLLLTRSIFSFGDRGSEAFHSEQLDVGEIDADGRMVANVSFDVDDIDAAFAELDARYLAGEAAAHARTWSLVAGGYAAFNRHALFAATTPDWVNIDHRRGAAFASGELIAYIQAAWEDSPDTRIYIEAVHRLSNIGAVVTHVAQGISQGGVYAEWRDLSVITADGDAVNRWELFDEADLDTAIARFDELHRQPARRLANAASRVCERFLAHLAADKWDAMAELLADDYYLDDHRSVVNAGVLRGRDAGIANMRAVADLRVTDVFVTVIATRSERLVLLRDSFSFGDQDPEAFRSEQIDIGEINSQGRVIANVSFDIGDIDAAFAELDRRYLAGEAAQHAHTWRVLLRAFAAFNGHELPATTPDWVNVDHRRGRAFAPGDLAPYIRAAWELAPQGKIYVEAVHRLTNLGAVVTQVLRGTSPDGFDAEWLDVNLLTVDGDLISRSELFNEEDLDAALTRFDELSHPHPRLENAATRVYERFWSHFAARDWDALAETVVENISGIDHRRVVNAGSRAGRAAVIEDLRVAADIGFTLTMVEVVATRGGRLAVVRVRGAGRDPETVQDDALNIIEIDTANRITSIAVFDLDDVDAAFADLDARYLAGEAAAHARTWSIIAASYAALNRHELPATAPDWVTVDHRQETAFQPGDVIAYIHAGWDDEHDINIYVEAVHRLDTRGAVVTYAAQEVSREGFQAEWRGIAVFTIEGDLINRTEVFDAAHLDAALARFDELHE